MSALHPAAPAHDGGELDVGDGHRIHWESSGARDGVPVVLLHGGPGSGSTPAMRRFFDPRAYRIVQYDQRGCGRSTPHGSLAANTTEHLLRDLERLRTHLGVARWLVFGVSWGSTLALAYAERHPVRVLGLLLVGVTMTRPSEIDWLYRGLAARLPDAWERFVAGAGPEGAVAGADLVAIYARLLNDPDAEVRERAARDWHDWEAASLSADPTSGPPAAWADADYRLARARIVTHYFRHAAWLEDGALLRGASKLAGIPGVMVQGSLDLQGPPETARELAAVWPDGELVELAGAGHTASDTGMTAAVLAATARFSTRGRT